MIQSYQLKHLAYLDTFLLFNSKDYETIKQQISYYLCPHQFEVEAPKKLNVRLNGFRFGSSALYDLKYSAPVEIVINKDSESYFFRISVEGHCEIWQEQNQIHQFPGVMTVSQPDSQHRITTNHHCRNIILKLTKADIETQLSKMLGYSPTSPLLFDSYLPCTSDAMGSIIETIDYLCHAYYNIKNWLLLAESFTDYLTQLILLKVPNNYSQQLNIKSKFVLPHYMKKAEQYILHHLKLNITLSELSEYSGVTARTLQKGFNQYFNQTPIEFIRDKRLELIHTQLQQGPRGETVTEIMLRNGINSFGHFSKIYKKRYGCVPSKTLKMNLLKALDIYS